MKLFSIKKRFFFYYMLRFDKLELQVSAWSITFIFVKSKKWPVLSVKRCLTAVSFSVLCWYIFLLSKLRVFTMSVAPHVSHLNLYLTFLIVSLNGKRLPIVHGALNATLNSTWGKLLLTCCFRRNANSSAFLWTIG